MIGRIPMRVSRNRPRSSQAGFTLIELVIVITLVAAISAGLLMTLRTGLLTLERTQLRLDENRRAVTTLDMIRRQIGGAMPVRAQCGGGDRSATTDIFRGNAEILLLVTNESLTEGSRGYPRIAEYRWAANPDGTVRLEVRESVFSGPASTQPFCSMPYAIVPSTVQPVVLLDKLAYGRFRYRSMELSSQLGRRWEPQWELPMLPYFVRLEMLAAPQGENRMPITTITVPLHISREPGAVYSSAF